MGGRSDGSPEPLPVPRFERQSGVSFRHACPIVLTLTLLHGAPAHAGQTVGTATGSIVGTARDITKAILSGVDIEVSGSLLMQPRQSSSGKLALGGSKMSASAEAVYKLLFGTIGDPIRYQQAKRSALLLLSGKLSQLSLAQPSQHLGRRSQILLFA